MNPNTWEMRAKESEIQGQTQLHVKSEASLGYMRVPQKRKGEEERKGEGKEKRKSNHNKTLFLIHCNDKSQVAESNWHPSTWEVE